jgi:hypothetical protein
MFYHTRDEHANHYTTDAVDIQMEGGCGEQRLDRLGIRLVGRYVYPRIVVSVNRHYENPTRRGGLVQSGSHHHLIER